MGSEVFLHFASTRRRSDCRRSSARLVGDEALEAADVQTHHHGSPFIAKVARGTAVREGEQAVLTLNTHLLHFFSLETGEAI